MSIDTTTFHLIHTSGAKLYPYRVKNLKTGKVAFRVAAPGKRDAFGLAEELDDISEVMRKVVDQGYSVRAKNREGDLHGSYKVGGREIEGWARVEP